MRSFLIPLALTTIVCLFSACSEDESNPCSCPPIQEQPLAQIVRTYTGSVGLTINSLCIDYSYATGDTLYCLSLDVTDKEQKYTFDNTNNPDFDRAVAMLTNGVDDNLLLYLRMPNGTHLQGGWTTEVMLFRGGYSGEYYPDLEGAEITRVDVYIQDIWFQHSPPNTTYFLLFNAVIMGRP